MSKIADEGRLDDNGGKIRWLGFGGISDGCNRKLLSIYLAETKTPEGLQVPLIEIYKCFGEFLSIDSGCFVWNCEFVDWFSLSTSHSILLSSCRDHQTASKSSRPSNYLKISIETSRFLIKINQFNKNNRLKTTDLSRVVNEGLHGRFTKSSITVCDMFTITRDA